jgi:hypothetical protein
MSNNRVNENLMERLASVDSKLEKLLTQQTLSQDEDLDETQPPLDEKFSEEILVADFENEEIHPAGFSEGPKNSLPFRVAVSAREADSIFQKVDKINRDVEIMGRVEKLEGQNRKIVILGSMFITLTVLMLGVFTFLIIQANLLNQNIFLKTSQRINPSQPSSGEAAAKVTVPQSPKPLAEVHDPKPVEPIAQSDPQPMATLAVPKPAETTHPGKYVGSITSNKYHYPGCKWAAQIRRDNLLNFSTTEEARKRRYIPCPTCRPPHSDQEKSGP